MSPKNRELLHQNDPLSTPSGLRKGQRKVIWLGRKESIIVNQQNKEIYIKQKKSQRKTIIP